MAAAQAGADAIGLVFYSGSPRAVDVEKARSIIAALPPFVTVVGLFVNEQAGRIRAVLDAVPLDLLQFHGAEPPEACRTFGRPYLKAISMKPGVQLETVTERYPDAAGFLVDTWHPDVAGGTGESFDWSVLPAGLDRPLVLAGGLGPDNVAAAVQAVRPWAVDVSSGVEVSKGVKDPEKMSAFVQEVLHVDRRS